MMQIMRKHAKKLLIFIALIIIPAFVFWGAGSALRRRSSSEYAGKIFGRRVSLKEYSKSWQACRNQALMLYGENIDKVAQFLNLEEQAWERLIMLKESKRKKVTAKDEEVVEVIKSLPFFQKDLKFDKETYETTLRYVFGTTPIDFEEQIKNSLTIQKLVEDVLKDIDITDEEVRQAYRQENEKVKVSYITFNIKDYQSKVAIDQKDLENYYKKRSSDFKQPPKVKVEYIAVTYDDLKNNIDIADDEILEYFKDHEEDFSQAKETSQEESLSIDEEAQAIMTDEAKNKIKMILLDKKVKEKAADKANKISKFLIREADLSKVSEEFSATLEETDYFSATEPIPGVGWSYEFNQKAFSSGIGDVSDTIKVHQKGFFFLKVLDKKNAVIPDFEKIKQEVELKYIIYKADELAKNDAGDRLKALNEYLGDGDSWQDALNKLSLEAENTSFFKRADYIKNIGYSKEFMHVSFSTEPGELYNEVIPLQRGYCLIKPDEKKDIDEEKFENQKEEFKRKYIALKKQTQYKDWIDNLKKKANLKSNLDDLRRKAQESGQ